MTIREELEFEATCLKMSVQKMGMALNEARTKEGIENYLQTIYTSIPCVERLRVIAGKLEDKEEVAVYDVMLAEIKKIKESILTPLRK